MANVIIQKATFLRNILNLTNSMKFRLLSPRIASFLKQICNQISQNKYNNTTYMNLFLKINFKLCSDPELVLIYEVLEAFFYLKSNQDSTTIVFNTTKPTQTSFLTGCDQDFKLLPKTTTLKSAITTGKIQTNWQTLIKDFFDLVNKGDKEDLLSATQSMVDSLNHVRPRSNTAPNARPEQKIPEERRRSSTLVTQRRLSMPRRSLNPQNSPTSDRPPELPHVPSPELQQKTHTTPEKPITGRPTNVARRTNEPGFTTPSSRRSGRTVKANSGQGLPRKPGFYKKSNKQ